MTSGYLDLNHSRTSTNLESRITGSLVISGRSRYLAVAAIIRSCSSGMLLMAEAVLRISKLSGLTAAGFFKGNH
jgi:hypothetical protein